MFLKLNHMALDIFQVSKKITIECYKQSRTFPKEELYAIVMQIRRASLSVHLNIAEGCSRKSEKDRKRYYSIARSSLVEVDTALDLAIELNLTNKEKISVLGELLLRCFQM